MDNIYNFIYKDNNIIIIEKDGLYWFQGLSVCDILKYNNPHKALKTHIPERYKSNYSDLINDKKYHAQTIFISEPGLYRLILKSKQPNAIEFQDWISDDLLTSLRKNGYYELNKKTIENINVLYNKYKKIKEENLNLKNLLENEKNAKNGIIYCKEVESDNGIKYKIGSTENSVKRERTYKTGNLKTKDYKYYI